jgi:multicomponent Na+:H+ antiporter subunit F
VSDFYLATAVFLLVTVAAGLVRVWKGPGPADRMLVAQLFGTTGVAVLLLAAEAWDAVALKDVALVLSLMAAVVGLTFARRGWGVDPEEAERG